MPNAVKIKNHEISPSAAPSAAPVSDRSKLRLPTQAGAKTPIKPLPKPSVPLPRADSNPPAGGGAADAVSARGGEALEMSASVDAASAVAVPAVPPTVEEAGGAVEQARTLIAALNLLSRNLPLPPDVMRAVSSIYHDGGAGDRAGE